MNWSLEMTRALTGGIGIVLTIPITIGLMVTIFKWSKSMTTIFYSHYYFYFNGFAWR